MVERLQHLGHDGVAWQQCRAVGVTGPPASPVVLCSTWDAPTVKVRTASSLCSQCERPPLQDPLQRFFWADGRSQHVVWALLHQRVIPANLISICRSQL